MSEYIRRALERRLDNFIPKSDNEILRKKAIKDYALIFNNEEIAEILNGKNRFILIGKKANGFICLNNYFLLSNSE